MRLNWISMILVLFVLAACSKTDEISYDPTHKLSLSADTLLFDTVFTTVGSTSRLVKIHNRNAKAVVISSVKLGTGSESPFSLIINGQAVNSKENLHLDGRDSISIYAKVTINPTSTAQPFIVQDSIIILTNGNRQAVALVAFGQNANFLNAKTITGAAHWNNVLPYVIYKSLEVAENATLSIAPGTRVLFHGNAAMNVKGTLLAAGSKTQAISFTSDRLEKSFEDEPGQWSGLHFFSSSKNSVIQYAVLKNAIVGITADSLPGNDQPKLLLSNTVVKNMEVAGFVGYGTTLAAFNNLFYNCGQYLLYAVGGGTYDIKQNTFAAYNFNFPRRTAAVYFSDYTSSTQKGRMELDLINNIIWGSLNDELLIELKTGAGLLASIRYNLLKSTKSEYNRDNNILNSDPLFVNPELQNYRLKANSPAIKKGDDLSADRYYPGLLSLDHVGNTRIFPSDLGSYENN